MGVLGDTLPDPVRLALRRTQGVVSTRGAKRAFVTAGPEPRWLSPDRLEELADRYVAPASYDYTDTAKWKRGHQRAARLSALMPGSGATLEVGAGDGMVSYHLAQSGCTPTGLDLSSHLFDPRARAAGVRMVEGDAAAMPLDSGAFDLVFSYNSFEHFADPAAVLSELVRVTRPGGLIHVDFGPLYLSPYGLHGYRSVPVPYCHLLFERQVLDDFAVQRGARPIPWETLNEWRLVDFRRLWAEAPLDVVSYGEFPQFAGLELVRRYPSCFRAETDNFDDLTAATVRATFRRQLV